MTSSAAPEATDGSPGRSNQTSITRLLLVGRLNGLAAVVLLVLGISALASLYPLLPWSPEVPLRLAKVLIDYSPGVVLAITMVMLAEFFQSRELLPPQKRRLSRRLATGALLLYAALIPIQIVAYVLLSQFSAGQIQQVLSAADARVKPVAERVRIATNSDELLSALAQIRPLPPLVQPLPPLDQQKREVFTAIDRERSQLNARLSGERRGLLISRFVSTARGVLAALVLSIGFRYARRLA